MGISINTAIWGSSHQNSEENFDSILGSSVVALVVVAAWRVTTGN